MSRRAASTAYRTSEAHYSSVSRPSGRLEQPVVSAARRPPAAPRSRRRGHGRARAPLSIDPAGRDLAPRAPRAPGRGERIAGHPRSIRRKQVAR